MATTKMKINIIVLSAKDVQNDIQNDMKIRANVRSERDEATYYHVVYKHGWQCDCPHWIFRRPVGGCKHIRLVHAVLNDPSQPEVLRRYFTLDWSIFQVEIPESLPFDIFEQERIKFQTQLDDVFVQCRAALRESLADLIGHLADRLAPDSDGSRKRLCTSTVEQLLAFLDTVNARDITSDKAIRSLSDKARAILGKYTDKQLKSAWTSDRVRTGLVAIKTELDALIQREGSRKIDLDLE